MTSGERIKSARIQKGITQNALAKSLGVTPAMVGQYERDLRNPKPDTIRKIAEALDVPALSLYGDEALPWLVSGHLGETLRNAFEQQNEALRRMLSTFSTESGFDADIAIEKRMELLLASFQEWSYPDFSAFIDTLTAATDNEKQQIWKYAKFLKEQRPIEDSPTND